MTDRELDAMQSHDDAFMSSVRSLVEYERARAYRAGYGRGVKDGAERADQYASAKFGSSAGDSAASHVLALLDGMDDDVLSKRGADPQFIPSHRQADANLVDRLRAYNAEIGGGPGVTKNAIDEIERLRQIEDASQTLVAEIRRSGSHECYSILARLLPDRDPDPYVR